MFCQYCGKAVDDAAQFCTGCGKRRIGVAPLAGPELAAQKMGSHLRTLGILWIVYSAFRVLMGVWALAVSRYMLPMMSGFFPREENALPISIMDMLHAVYTFSFAYSLVMGTIGLVAAWALLQRKTWGRVLAIVIAIISVISVPFGTALAVYTFVVLLSSDAEQSYRRLAVPA